MACDPDRYELSDMTVLRSAAENSALVLSAWPAARKFIQPLKMFARCRSSSKDRVHYSVAYHDLSTICLATMSQPQSGMHAEQNKSITVAL